MSKSLYHRLNSRNCRFSYKFQRNMIMILVNPIYKITLGIILQQRDGFTKLRRRFYLYGQKKPLISISFFQIYSGITSSCPGKIKSGLSIFSLLALYIFCHPCILPYSRREISYNHSSCFTITLLI